MIDITKIKFVLYFYYGVLIPYLTEIHLVVSDMNCASETDGFAYALVFCGMRKHTIHARVIRCVVK